MPASAEATATTTQPRLVWYVLSHGVESQWLRRFTETRDILPAGQDGERTGYFADESLSRFFKITGQSQWRAGESPDAVAGRAVKLRGAVRDLAFLLAIVGSACSGKTSEISCGPGTQLVDGQCVAVSSGGAGGASGAGGSRTLADAEVSGDAPPDIKTDSGEPADVASRDVVSDTSGTDANPTGDDPCPTLPIIYNCSGSCGVRQYCPPVHCKNTTPIPVDIVQRATMPVVLRTSHALSSPDPECVPICQGAVPTAMFTIAGAGGPYFFRYTAPAPWAISTRDPSYCGADAAHCVVTNRSVELVTFERNAPVRNVVIEPVQEGATCP